LFFFFFICLVRSAAYSRNIQVAHSEALRVSNQEIPTLLHAQPADIMQNVLMSEGTADANIGKHYDEMD
jgi:hypothetical protein